MMNDDVNGKNVNTNDTRVSADVGFMFVTYSLRWLMNIIDKTCSQSSLKNLWLYFFQKQDC